MGIYDFIRNERASAKIFSPLIEGIKETKLGLDPLNTKQEKILYSLWNIFLHTTVRLNSRIEILLFRNAGPESFHTTFEFTTCDRPLHIYNSSTKAYITKRNPYYNWYD